MSTGVENVWFFPALWNRNWNFLTIGTGTGTGNATCEKVGT